MAEGTTPLIVNWRTGTPIPYPLRPPNNYISGRAYTGFNYQGNSVTNLSAVANVLYTLPISIHTTHAFNSITIGLTLITATDFRMGLYKMGLDGKPGALITDYGNNGAAFNGVNFQAINSYLEPDVYALAVVFNGTVTVTSVPFNDGALMNAWGTSTSLINCTTLYSKAHTFGALPDPFGAGAFSNADSPHMRIWAV